MLGQVFEGKPSLPLCPSDVIDRGCCKFLEMGGIEGPELENGEVRSSDIEHSTVLQNDSSEPLEDTQELLQGDVNG